MTDLPDTEREAPAVEASILGSLRESRSQIGIDSKPLDLAVPGYDNKLVVRYKWIPFKELSRTAQQLSKMTEMSEQALAAAADAVVATCQEVMVTVPEGEGVKLVPLSTNSIPITFADGDRLSYALGVSKPGSAREMAVLTFKNEYSLIEQAGIVVDWLKDTTKKVDEAFLGE